MAKSLKEIAARGLFWGAVNSGMTQVLNLLIGIFLARLLTPVDYGIIGVLGVFVAIAGNIQDSGFGVGLINIKKPTRNDYNSVFWFNVLTSASLYIILFFSAPLIAKFFHEPRLVVLSRVLFVAFFIAALGIASAAYMRKNMMIREIAIVGTVALTVSGIVGIVLASRGYAYWSLAWQQLTYISVLTIGRFFYTPRIVSLHIDFGPVKKMFPFCVKILTTTIINTISSNILTFIFGRLYPLKSVGNFSQAYKWDNMASSLVAGTVGQIAQPVMVDVSNERDREARVFRKMMRFTAFLAFPAMFGLALIAHEFIIIAIGTKWEASVVLLQILCISGAFVPFYTVYQNLALGNGRSDVYLWCNIGLVALQMVVIISLHSLSMEIMVGAYSLLLILWLMVWQRFAYRQIGVTFIETCKDIMPFCLAAIVTMAITYFATAFIGNLILLLLSRIIIAALVYSAIMKLCRVVIFDECVKYIIRTMKSSCKNK